MALRVASRTDFQLSDDDAVDKPLLPLALPEGDASGLGGLGNGTFGGLLSHRATPSPIVS